MSRTNDYLELLRAPAVLTVIGDTLAGGAAANRSPFGRRIALPLASACLYAAGMALNDYADRDIDAVERPERPIPSGRVAPGAALVTAAGLTAAGLGLSAFGGGRSAVALGLPLAASIWAYDLVAKRNPVTGALSMGLCRALDVLMGAGSDRVRTALPAAAIMGGHTVAVTALSRGEVSGTSVAVASGATATTVVVSAGVLAGAALAGAQKLGRTSSESSILIRHLAATTAAIAVYASRCGSAQWRAIHEPSAGNALDATKAGIRSMIPLQAALALSHGSPVAGAIIGSLDVVGKVLRSGSRVKRISES
ncbi:SCO3242 family prenyltransferase [Glutamicibacter halophytocola]|uniref:4-hydroxybenzoate polyprenyltransferase n=1 Tax=Glutamicibacter halophytocola TaxID=1933880 RepID=A0A5B8ISA3_9MICC|nr:UbiA family prenyltransferase [Glutamicibacter halophytocola]NQD41907.1 UbiA family prenyltransferase [Glutamicibacter halophytocola]QDY67821.1 4-hydroxybenzoate polyprenyltransferase [Glutamicibacter halophytocola]UUX59999.1 UbiA family prenyltransferase [Glutamicibacter halophytocola]